jgi:hypothetical protein
LKQTSGFGFLKKIQTTNGFHERNWPAKNRWFRVGPFMEFFDLIFRARSKWSKLVLWFFDKQCPRVRTNNNPSSFLRTIGQDLHIPDSYPSVVFWKKLERTSQHWTWHKISLENTKLINQ